jgi:UPF0755 protein
MARSTRLLLGGGLLLATIAFGSQAAQLALFAFSPASAGPASKSIIEIRKGAAAGEIAQLLGAQGAVSDRKLFVWLGRVTRQWTRIKVGEYEVSSAQTPLEVFATITSGVSVAHPVTVREGQNMYEIAADLEAKKLASKDKVLALCKDPKFIASLGLKPPLGPTLEGYLFPDTYFFNRAMSAEDMLKQMVRHFQQKWTPEHDARAATLGLTQLQTLTLASIIEKETGAPHERPLISSAFHNRLRKKMKLQSDPTTVYGIWDRYQGNIRRSDLLSVNGYNTYTLPGLPIGPISNPGKEAIDAALNPAVSDYIFFVSHNDGTHEFTSTLAEHNAAVRKFQLDPKARMGKSWRDLKKGASPETATAPAQRNR